MKNVAVILSGCGVYDGAEIHESVLTLLALDEAGATVRCFAPDIPQHHVVDHRTGHADAALETFERALAIDPNYPPALLYRGQVLLEAKQDAEGAIRSWEKFVAVVPAGE